MGQIMIFELKDIVIVAIIITYILSQFYSLSVDATWEFLQTLGLQWRALDQEQKSQFEKMAELDKLRYQEELQSHLAQVCTSNLILS